VARVKCALIVEDDPPLAAALALFMRARAETVHVARTREEAERLMDAHVFDASLVDLALPDGSGVDLLERLWSQPAMPRVIVVSGSATPDTAFNLAQAGVRAFVPKPLALDALERAWEATLRRPPDLRPFVRASVGQVDLHTVEDVVRRSMTDEALAVAGSSRRRASSLLGISRQLLQHILRRRDDGGGSPATS
jgi:DNA-binding response OmpR family regulator